MLLVCTSFISADATTVIEKKVGVVFIINSAPFCASGGPCELSPRISGLIPNVLPPRATPAHYINLLNYTMTDYIQKASYGVSHLTFEAILNPDGPDGWFEAPHTMEEYLLTNSEIVVNDAVQLAYSAIGSEVQQYEILMVVENIQSQFGFTAGCRVYDPGEYVTCPVMAGGIQLDIARLSVGEHQDDESFLEVVGHELGHVHGLPHVRMGPYDIVGNSDVLTHYGGWSKVYAGWLKGYSDFPICTQGTCEEQVTLDPLERQGSSNVLRFPFTNSTSVKEFIGHYVECRAKIDFDTNIPKAGVVISSVDALNNPGLPAEAVFTHGGGPDDFTNVALSPGETWVDVANKLSINYISSDSVNRCTVKVKQGEITAPDLVIRMYEPDAENNPTNGYYSRDIWIDSQQNGWDAYTDTTFNGEGGQGAPTGYGDTFWANHENRIKFRLRNSGYGKAEDVLVNVYVRQPLSVTVPGINCPKTFEKADELVGSVLIDKLDKGEVYYGSVPWTPTTNTAALVTVDIQGVPGEITWRNNTAKEAYSPNAGQQLTLSTGNAGAVFISQFSHENLYILANNDCHYDLPIWMNPFVIDEKFKGVWQMEISGLQGIVQPGEESEYELRSMPPPDAKPGDCVDMGVVVSTMMDDLIAPVDGFTFRSCVVQAAQLTCKPNRTNVEPGQGIVIDGKLSPATTRAKIALEYTQPDGKKIIGNADLGTSGAYRHNLTVQLAGKWQVKAFWQGNDSLAPAESDVCTFEVKFSNPEFTLDYDSNCRSGPGKDYPVITSGRKGDVIRVDARDEGSRWLYGTVLGAKCWLSASLGQLNMDINDLPVRQAPAKPTPTTSFCQTLSTQSQCLRFKNKCQWVIPGGSCLPK